MSGPDAMPPAVPASVRGAAINVDIDSLHLYYRIHGLDEARATNAVWERGVVRFAELFARLDIKATFFVVASDIARWPAARAVAEDLVKAGHELASHSLTHPYDLVRQHDRAVRTELEQSRAIIGEMRGAPCTGFRAPGYTMTPRVLRMIREAGYRYDSSLFPCPPYYLAKLAVFGSMLLRGRRSESIVGPPSVMWEDRLPSVRDGLCEVPITVLPGLRFPIIGTSLLMLGERGYGLVRKALLGLPFVNLELHGIDLCDLAADGIDPVLLKQPDLRVPLVKKLSLFERVFRDLRDALGVGTLEAHVARLA